MNVAEPRIGIDGGQSGIRARVLAQDGRVLGEGRAPGFAYAGRASAAALGDGVRSAVLDAGWRSGASATSVVMGLSGLPRGAEIDEAVAVLDGLFSDAELHACGDHITAHAGATAGRPGIVAAVGTGAVIVGVGGAGVRTVDGWGALIDDAGSASWIGRAGLREALRHLDGRSAAADLADAVREAVGDLLSFQRALYESDRATELLAGLAPVVSRIAASGDPAAKALLGQAAEQVATGVLSASGALSDGEEQRVSLIGGVADSGRAFRGPLEAELARLLPQARLVPPEGDALAGACRLATGGTGPFSAFFSSYRVEHGRTSLVRRATRER